MQASLIIISISILILSSIPIWFFIRKKISVKTGIDALQDKRLLAHEQTISHIKDEIEKMKQLKVQKAHQIYHLIEFGRLSAGLFHDLMNPLTHLNLEINQLSTVGTSENKKVAEIIPQVMESSKRIERIIASARKYIQSKEHLEIFSLTNELHDVIEILNYKIKQQGVSIITYTPTDILLYGNPFKFHHIITNLISNAIDSYSTVADDRKPFVIRTSLRKEHEHIIFQVTDTGCGISEQVIDKIFDPFFTTKKENAGSGIGLSSTHDLVEHDFGGTITVESTLHKGSTFTVTIPYQDPTLKKLSNENKPH